jgi:GT2 family glycosyltransferase
MPDEKDGIPYGAVVIATKDRTDSLRSCLMCLLADRPAATIVVVDASDGDETENLCRKIDQTSLTILYHRAKLPSLTRQRNQGVDICRELGVEVIHFLDDDTDVKPGYLDAIERRLRIDIHIDGVGGIDENRILPRNSFFMSMFFLNSNSQNRVLRSGRNVGGQAADGREVKDVDWVSGGLVGYRATVFERERFDDRLRGYSWGEDFDFGFRVSRIGRLVVEPEARCNHHATPLNRYSQERLGREATILLYCWVKEQRSNGMSLTLFWWSIIGELLMRIANGAKASRRDEFSRVRGILSGLWCIWSKKASRTLG